MEREPIRWNLYVAAVIQLLVAFGVTISAEQTSAILDAVILLSPAFTVIFAEVARRFAWSPASKESAEISAYEKGRAGEPFHVE